jgi:hypothetical protein
MADKGTAADRKFIDLPVVNYMLSTMLVGPVQGLLNSAMRPAFVEQVKKQLVVLTTAYLQRAGTVR